MHQRLLVSMASLAGLLAFSPTLAADSDHDGIDDSVDNCVLVANPAQIDADGDGFGNLCDADLNQDCSINFSDLVILKNALFTTDASADLNSDGLVNFGDVALLRPTFLGTPGPSALFTHCNSVTELAATASANSELQAAANAVDGSLATRWETIHNVDPGILVLDLSRSFPLSRVEIHWEAANAGTYTIDGSNDNVGWVTLAHRSGGVFGERTDIVDISGTYRYLRMNGLVRSAGNVYGYSIWEMDVFGDAGAGVDIDIDTDDDGVIDALDLCPGTPPGSTVDADGCVVTAGVNEVAAANGILVGGPGSAQPGFAVYVFDNDLGTGGSVCNGGCALNWPPLLVDDAVASGVVGLSAIVRDDGSVQAAFDGRPLYFFSGDTSVDDTNGQGAGGVWWLVPYVPVYEPLFDSATVLEPALQVETPGALITRFADRARDRHAREDQYQAYDHWLSFYWEHRTAAVEIVDPVGRGGDTITFNVTSQWPLHPSQAELRFFYRGINTVAEYHNNAVMTRIGDTDYTRSISFNPKTGSALQPGDRLEFELSQFLSAPPNGRSNYYGTAFLYIVGQGLVPWEARGVFGDFSTELEDSYPIAPPGWLGGDGTLSYQYSDEPDNHFLQMPTNLSSVNGQVFVLGRRVHHTDFGDGSHNESPSNPVLGELAGLLGRNYINRSCVACHAKNGRAVPPATGSALRDYVVKVGTAGGEPDPSFGAVLQPLSTVGSPEGSVALSGWTESDGLRRPNYAFTPAEPGAFSARIAPQLVGMGLLEAIVESDIEALADPDDSDGDGISGRMRLVTDPETGQARLGRFGWKAGHARVKHQVAGALNTDLGVMTSLLPNPDCGTSQTDCGSAGSELADEHLEKLTAYVSLLGVPARRELDDPAALAGEVLFASAGCNACHIETLQTSAYHPHAELRDQTIHPYTDLLLHDMGPGLADSLGEGNATGAEWRTAPLWGIGLTAGVSGAEAYLHDGRARNLDEAIRWHGGEAEASMLVYSGMSASDKAAVIAFLQSL